MNNIAICAMTHNHPSIVVKLCKEICPLYNKYGVDLYLYDSSTNTESYEEYERAVKNGVTNLYYVRIDKPDGCTGNEKIRMCLQGLGHIKRYDYIMPIKDRSVLLETTLELLEKDSKNCYDAIVLEAYKIDCFLEDTNEKNFYSDPKELFYNYVTLLTDWQTCLFGRRLLDRVKWEEISLHYHFGDEEYCGQPFQQLIVLFDTLARINEPMVYVEKTECEMLDSIEKSLSGWRNSMKETWIELWPKAIKLLPNLYEEYKEYAIKKETMVPALFGDAFQLWHHKNDDIFKKSEYESIREEWNKYSDIPVEVMDYVYENELEKAKGLIEEDFLQAIKKSDYAKAFSVFEYGKLILLLYYPKDIWNGVYHAFRIYREEYNGYIKKGEMEKCFLAGCNTFEDIGKKYRCIKTILRKIKYGVNIEQHGEYAMMLKESDISDIAKQYIIGESIRLLTEK